MQRALRMNSKSMKTQVLDAKSNPQAGTQLGGRIIRDGGLVAFPTETVYGLGANGLSEEAVLRIFEVKGRPQDNPLILHVCRKSDVRELWDTVPEKAQLLMDVFWPGPLTLVHRKTDLVPDIVTAGLFTVALRMPKNKTARALIKAAGVPVAAPSANISGRPSPTTAQHVVEDLGEKIPLILDGGPCEVGVESTVLLLGSPPVLLRPGAVTKEMLEAVIGQIELHKSLLKPLCETTQAASPGMKYTHYAPKAKVIVVKGSPKRMAGRVLELYAMFGASGKTCVILCSSQSEPFFKGKEYAILGNRDEPQTLNANLFSALREYGEKADVLLCEGISAEGAGLAFMNRLLRAAGYLCIDADK
mgnify:FL=1